MYRGVLLYGDSGSGKSSLVNAGLIPEALALGFEPDRLRVQPRAGGELVVERTVTADDEQDVLPSLLALDEDASVRTVLSVDAFEARIRAACERHRPLLIFDQFEEIVTLFDEAELRDSQRRLVELFVRLLHGSLPVKLLFSFREDHLGRVKELLAACPELVDQGLRIAPPTEEALPTIIRGPFERFPDHFARELSPALAERLVRVLAERFGAGELSLSEVQTVCLRLWQSDSPEALLDAKGPQGLLEDYLGEALAEMPAHLREAAIALLGQMVTSAGTRNVISAGDLFERVRLWDVGSRRQVAARRMTGATSAFSVAFSPDGRTLAAGSYDGRVRLWDLAGGKLLGLLPTASSKIVLSVAFSPDGRTLAAGSGRVQLWDTATREQLGSQLRANGKTVESVAFSPDGHTLAAGGDDGTVRLWSGFSWRDFAALRDQVCRLVGDDLSPAEWTQYAPAMAYRDSCR